MVDKTKLTEEEIRVERKRLESVAEMFNGIEEAREKLYKNSRGSFLDLAAGRRWAPSTAIAYSGMLNMPPALSHILVPDLERDYVEIVAPMIREHGDVMMDELAGIGQALAAIQLGFKPPYHDEEKETREISGKLVHEFLVEKEHPLNKEEISKLSNIRGIEYAMHTAGYVSGRLAEPASDNLNELLDKFHLILNEMVYHLFRGWIIGLSHVENGKRTPGVDYAMLARTFEKVIPLVNIDFVSTDPSHPLGEKVYMRKNADAESGPTTGDEVPETGLH